MRPLCLAIVAALLAGLPSIAAADPTPAPKKVSVNYDCSDKKTRIVYDDVKDIAYLHYAGKRIIMTRDTADDQRFLNAKYHLEWAMKKNVAILSSLDAKTGEHVATLATCTPIKKKKTGA